MEYLLRNLLRDCRDEIIFMVLNHEDDTGLGTARLYFFVGHTVVVGVWMVEIFVFWDWGEYIWLGGVWGQALPMSLKAGTSGAGGRGFGMVFMLVGESKLSRKRRGFGGDYGFG